MATWLEFQYPSVLDCSCTDCTGVRSVTSADTLHHHQAVHHQHQQTENYHALANHTLSDQQNIRNLSAPYHRPTAVPLPVTKPPRVEANVKPAAVLNTPPASSSSMSFSFNMESCSRITDTAAGAAWPMVTSFQLDLNSPPSPNTPSTPQSNGPHTPCNDIDLDDQALQAKRAEQNRISQRNFRLRRKAYIKDLETKAAKLDEARTTITRMRAKNQELQNRLAELEMVILSSGTRVPDHSPHET